MTPLRRAAFASIGLFVTTLAAASAQAQTLHFSDGDFWNEDWTTMAELLNGGGTAGGSQFNTGGDPLHYRRTPIQTFDATGFGFSNSVFAFHARLGATFDPAALGAITSIDYEESSLRLLNGQQSCGFALRQGGVVYYGPSFLNATTPSTWVTTTQLALTAANFDALAPGVQHPDFSAAGAPIQFGFFRANSTSVGGSGSTIIGAIDNWDVVVHYEQPVPAVASTWGELKARYAKNAAR